jgi:hypothetical protein
MRLKRKEAIDLYNEIELILGFVSVDGDGEAGYQ